MMRISRRRSIAALAIFLTLAGAGTASAYWSASDAVAGSTKAATVGITQTVHPTAAATPLKTTYSASNLSAAGAVSVSNTGSREASYTLTVRATSSSVSGLPAAIGVSIAAVGSADACTPTTSLVSPATGKLSTSTPFTFTGSVAAGKSVVLCVKTAMSASDTTAYADQTAELAMQSRLAYGTGAGAWTQSAASVSFTQDVGSSLLFFTDSSGRYIIRNQGTCIQRYPSMGTYYLARDSNCGSWAEQWRFFRAADGTFRIAWAQNTTYEAVAPRWTALNGSQTLQTRSADATQQRWKIVGIAGDQYRIESVAYPGQCATVGDGLWSWNDGNPRRLLLTTCTDAATQRFTFELQGTPITPLEEANCVRQGQYLQFGFSVNREYQQEISYRALLARQATPDTKKSLTLSTSSGLDDGWNTYLRIYDAGTNLSSYVGGSGGGVGNTWVYIEQQIAGSPWSTTARAKFHIARSGGQLTISCGWR